MPAMAIATLARSMLLFEKAHLEQHVAGTELLREQLNPIRRLRKRQSNDLGFPHR